MTNTRDLSKFGFRELEETARLLTAYCDMPKEILKHLGHGVAVEFNQDSGKVFLVDEDFNIAMMNGDKLEPFYSCVYCGHEGFKQDMKHEEQSDTNECTEYLRSIGIFESQEEQEIHDTEFK